MKLHLLPALFAAATLPLCHAGDQAWSRLAGCTLLENPANDGDSFHVKYRSKEFIFRLYFVDTCETSRQVPKRVKEQAEELGITEDRVLEAGKVAEDLTHAQLAGRPFTVVTCWQDARGASRLPRYYAFVLYGAKDGYDLASTLAQNGLVRVYGMPAEPPGPMSASTFQKMLRKLEAFAKKQHLGVYGDLSTTAATPASLQSGAEAASKPSRTNIPLSFLLPAALHSPDIVENPADDQVADYAVEAAEKKMVIQTGIPEDDFSEIPGWKPPAKKKAPEPEEVPD